MVLQLRPTYMGWVPRAVAATGVECLDRSSHQVAVEYFTVGGLKFETVAALQRLLFARARWRLRVEHRRVGFWVCGVNRSAAASERTEYTEQQGPGAVCRAFTPRKGMERARLLRRSATTRDAAPSAAVLGCHPFLILHLLNLVHMDTRLPTAAAALSRHACYVLSAAASAYFTHWCSQAHSLTRHSAHCDTAAVPFLWLNARRVQ